MERLRHRSWSHAAGTMSRRITDVLVLAEDKCQQNFAYHYLRSLGVDTRRIRKLSLPLGGSGEQYVRGRYPEQVGFCRQRDHRNLVVAVDADLETVETRKRQLDDRLQESGLEPRSAGEKIAILVPRRNIETWIVALRGGLVNEERDYKTPRGCDNAAQAAQAFFARTRPRTPNLPLDSLRKAVPEIRRIEDPQ
jgi:hypothetical protein